MALQAETPEHSLCPPCGSPGELVASCKPGSELLPDPDHTSPLISDPQLQICEKINVCLRFKPHSSRFLLRAEGGKQDTQPPVPPSQPLPDIAVLSFLSLLPARGL